MVMKAEPFFRAFESIWPDGKGEGDVVALLTPRGSRFDQRAARRFARVARLMLLCGRYEGIDERVAEFLATEELDFRSTPDLPRMPDPVDDPDERQRQASWIRRFHRLGARTFDPAPRLPVRPAVLDSLAATLRETSPDPFVLARSDDTARPIAARGLRELLEEELDAMEDESYVV